MIRTVGEDDLIHAENGDILFVTLPNETMILATRVPRPEDLPAEESETEALMWMIANIDAPDWPTYYTTAELVGSVNTPPEDPEDQPRWLQVGVGYDIMSDGVFTREVFWDPTPSNHPDDLRETLDYCLERIEEYKKRAQRIAEWLKGADA